MLMHNHPYHMVSNSPWPILTSMIMMNMFLMNLLFMKNKNFYFFLLTLILMIMSMLQWWRDIIRESTFQGMHTKKCKYTIKFSMIMFILSEIMFFFSMFWCYMHMFLSPNIEIGQMWPPKMIIMFNPFEIPLINTIILISSGFTLTLSHNLMINNKFYKSLIMMNLTIILGILFTLLQIFEYYSSMFTMSDSIYGSIFFMLTGFHGIHVIIGTIFLIFMMLIMKNQFSPNNHMGYELSSWYWHFVDLIWLMLYSLIYWYSY